MARSRARSYFWWSHCCSSDASYWSSLHLEVRDSGGVDLLALGVELPAVASVALTDAPANQPSMYHLVDQSVLQLPAWSQPQQRLAQPDDASSSRLWVTNATTSAYYCFVKRLSIFSWSHCIWGLCTAVSKATEARSLPCHLSRAPLHHTAA